MRTENSANVRSQQAVPESKTVCESEETTPHAEGDEAGVTY